MAIIDLGHNEFFEGVYNAMGLIMLILLICNLVLIILVILKNKKNTKKSIKYYILMLALPWIWKLMDITTMCMCGYHFGHNPSFLRILTIIIIFPVPCLVLNIIGTIRISKLLKI